MEKLRKFFDPKIEVNLPNPSLLTEPAKAADMISLSTQGLRGRIILGAKD